MMTNEGNTVIYTGITNDIERRAYEHKHGLVEGFTKKYRVTKLVYYEIFDRAYDAISREKQIKAGPRRNKIKLIESVNPKWIEIKLN